MLREYDLNDPVLTRIARIIDEADVVQESPVEAIAPGLDAICRDICRISLDDHVAIERGGLLFDAIYAQITAEIRDQ
jgi:hypothetical protein